MPDHIARGAGTASIARSPARRSTLLSALVLAIVWLVFSCAEQANGSEEAKRAGVPAIEAEIIIASEGSRPPFNYLEGNELAGFEIDLARALCARMKVTCSFVTQDWDSLVPGLITHQYDAIMAAMEITDEMRARIAFTAPYVSMPSAFMAARDSGITDTSSAGLEDKRIGVESGGAHESYARDVFKQSEIAPHASLEEAILDLAEGRLDFVLGDKDALSDFARTRREAQCCTLVGDVPHDPAYFGDGIGIGLRHEDKELLGRFDRALADVRADGTFARIRAKYFDFEIN